MKNKKSMQKRLSSLRVAVRAWRSVKELES